MESSWDNPGWIDNPCENIPVYFDGVVQDCGNSSALALELTTVLPWVIDVIYMYIPVTN